jgi:multiple sugar transport system permease protein
VRRRGGPILVNTVLAAGAAVTLTPILWMLSAATMPTGEATTVPPSFFPSRPTLAHYGELFTRLNLGRSFANSLIVATVVTFLSLAANGMAGYAFAKLRFTGRDRLFSVLLAAMLVPAPVAMLPLFLILRAMGLVNTYAGVVLPAISTILGIFLIRQFALSIPDDLLDAARLEGAGELAIFRRIVLPLLLPVLTTLGIVTFLSTWNDFLWPLVVLTGESRYTLPVSLAILSGEHAQDTELMMAGSVLTVLPVLLLFLALQRYYIAGILIGGVKE